MSKRHNQGRLPGGGGRIRLTPEQHVAIKAAREAGAQLGELADRFGISKESVTRAIRRGDGGKLSDFILPNEVIDGPG